MVVIARRASILLAFVALGASAGATDDDGASSLLRASSSSSDDGVHSLGSKKGGDVAPLGRHSHSRGYQRVGQIDTVIATITIPGVCPSDFTFSNNQCIQTGPSEISCPEGYTEEEAGFPGTTPEVIFRNRTCAFFQFGLLPEVTCENGALDGITCFEFEDVAPDFVGCDPGFELTYLGCVSTETIPAGDPQCDVGELGPDNGCFEIQAVAATATCPPGESFLGDDGVTCVTRTEVGPPTIGCPEGFSVGEGSTCVSTETSGKVPTCDGLVGELQGNQCVDTSSIDANINCGEGFELIENGCFQFEAAAPTFSCPAGFTAINDFDCELELSAPSIPQCSVYEAFFDAELQSCVVVTQGDLPVLECEDGAEIQDNACVFITTVAATVVCEDADYILTNTPSGDGQVCKKCVSTGIVGGEVTVEDRAHHGGHRAHKHQIEEGDESTETKTAEQVPTLRRLQTSDEANTEAAVDAPGQAPPQANATTYHHHGGHGGEGTDPNTGLGGGETFSCTTVDISFECAAGFITSPIDGTLCIQIEAAAGIVVCPVGLTLSGDQSACESSELSPPSFVCDPGFTLSATDSSTCTQTQSEPKSAECNAGGELVDNVCEGVPVVGDTNLSCADGLELQGDQCVAFAAVAAALGCPAGFSLGEDGSSCTLTTTVPGQGECEGEGVFLEGGQCISYPGVEATLSCDEGRILSGLECQLFEAVAPATVCPQGFEETNGECVKTTTSFPNIDCPEGSFVQDGKCVISSGVAAGAVCPQDFVAVPIFDNTAFGCFDLVAPSAFCPLGGELTVGDECIISAQAPATSPTIAPPTRGGSGLHGHGSHKKNGGHSKNGGHNKNGDHNGHDTSHH